jgi:hypothetical protein
MIKRNGHSRAGGNPAEKKHGVADKGGSRCGYLINWIFLADSPRIGLSGIGMTWCEVLGL